MRYRLLWLAGLLVAPLLHASVATAQPAARPLHAAAQADTVQALLARAQAAFDKGDYLTARALFTQATALAPQNAVAWAGKARSENWLGDDTDAVADYTVAIHYAPTNAIYYLRRGISYNDLGDAPHALADYSMAIHLAPGYADAYYDRGAFYFNHGQYAPSLGDYAQAIRLRPTWWQAYYYRGKDEVVLGLYQAAISDMTTYIQHTNRAACGCAYTLRGNAFYNLHQYAQALADYRQAIAIGPAENAEYYNCGKAAYRLGKYALAISCFTHAIALRPDDAQAYYFRGLARRDSGDKPGAIADERLAVKFFILQGDPGSAQLATEVLQQLHATP